MGGCARESGATGSRAKCDYGCMIYWEIFLGSGGTLSAVPGPLASTPHTYFMVLLAGALACLFLAALLSPAAAQGIKLLGDHGSARAE